MAGKRKRSSSAGRVSKKRKVGKYSRFRKGKKKNVINRSMVAVGKGFPKKMTMTHKYVETIEIDSTLGARTVYIYSCNGMFDPNFSGTGHQPMYFDNMTAIYDHYTVIGSKIKATYTPLTVSDGNLPAQIGIYKDDDTTTALTVEAAAEQDNGKIMAVGVNATWPKKLYNKWSAKKTFGGSVLGNDRLQGDSSNNPAEQTYYVLIVQGTTAVNVSYIVTVEIEYIAVWDELKTQNLN